MEWYSKYRNGLEFEEAVFGLHSHGDSMFEKFGRDTTDFSEDIRSFIENTDACPQGIGESIWWQTGKRLSHLGVDPEGLIFFPGVNSKIDLFHGTDGLFFHPALWPRIVTVDLFHMHPGHYLEMLDSWIDEFKGCVFTPEDAQNNLFLFKRGLSVWHRINRDKIEEARRHGQVVVKPEDFRPYADRGRWLNHFIFTPYHITRIKDFARMVAEYLAGSAEAQYNL